MLTGRLSGFLSSRDEFALLFEEEISAGDRQSKQSQHTPEQRGKRRASITQSNAERRMKLSDGIFRPNHRGED